MTKMKIFSLTMVTVVMGLAAFSPALGQQCVSEPAALAQYQMWYINSTPIVFKGKRYLKYGLPRVLGPTEVVPVGKYKTANISAEPGAKANPEVIYVSVRERCEFQPYQLDEQSGCSPIEVRIASRSGREKGRAVYVFSALAKPPAKPLRYKWTIQALTAAGRELPDPDKYVLGGTTGQELVISKGKLPKKTSARVRVEVEQAKTDCGVAEDSAIVQIP